MAKAVSFITPFPGVSYTVGSLSMHSTDPERRVWNVTASVNMGNWSDDNRLTFDLGEYSAGLRVREQIAARNYSPMVWDVLSIALYNDDGSDDAFVEALNKYQPGAAHEIYQHCVDSELMLFGN